MFGFRELFKLTHCEDLSLSGLYDTTWSDTTKMKDFFLNKIRFCWNLQVAVCSSLTTIHQTPGCNLSASCLPAHCLGFLCLRGGVGAWTWSSPRCQHLWPGENLEEASKWAAVPRAAWGTAISSPRCLFIFFFKQQSFLFKMKPKQNIYFLLKWSYSLLEFKHINSWSVCRQLRIIEELLCFRGHGGLKIHASAGL